jgi:hypothetical protein
MQCPICDGSARNRTPPDYDGIVVSCISCGNFEIASGYLDKLRALEPSERSEVLNKAKRLAKFASPSIDRRCF